jgi:hypothetical protein
LNGFPSSEEQKTFEILAHEHEVQKGTPSPRSKDVISYDDLLQCVENKNYGELVKSELEEYLSDAEFLHCFQMDRVSNLAIK